MGRVAGRAGAWGRYKKVSGGLNKRCTVTPVSCSVFDPPILLIPKTYVQTEQYKGHVQSWCLGKGERRATCYGQMQRVSVCSVENHWPV